MAQLVHAKKQYQKINRRPASPRQTLLTVYSEAISACFERDTLQSIKALAALQLSLNPNDTSKITHQLYTIYDCCLQLIEEQQFNLVAETLIALRSSITS